MAAHVLMSITSGKINSSNLCFIFFLTVQLLFYEVVEGEFQVIGSPDPILAIESDDVVLPCHVEPPDDMVASVLEWSKLKQHSDLNGSLAEVDFVHVYRDAHELLDLKLPSYFGRTSLLDDGLRRGDMSLRISNVTVADGGRYRCYIPTLENRNRFFVSLVVTAKTPLPPNNTQTNETSPNSSGSCRQSSIGVLILCIAVAAQNRHV